MTAPIQGLLTREHRERQRDQDAATKEMMLRIARDCDGVLSLNVAKTPHIFKEVRAASLDAMVSHVGDQWAAEQYSSGARTAGIRKRSDRARGGAARCS